MLFYKLLKKHIVNISHCHFQKVGHGNTCLLCCSLAAFSAGLFLGFGCFFLRFHIVAVGVSLLHNGLSFRIQFRFSGNAQFHKAFRLCIINENDLARQNQLRGCTSFRPEAIAAGNDLNDLHIPAPFS